jgi:hypothetical protein
MSSTQQPTSDGKPSTELVLAANGVSAPAEQTELEAGPAKSEEPPTLVEGAPKKKERAKADARSPREVEPPTAPEPKPRTPPMVNGPGGVVSVPVRLYGFLPIVHVGIFSDTRSPMGQLMVYHASRRYGAIVHTLWEDFVWGRSGEARLEGYPGSLEPAEVIARAKERIGRRYDVKRYNCEHFVADVHGLTPMSPQWVAWMRKVISIAPDPWGR